MADGAERVARPEADPTSSAAIRKPGRAHARRSDSGHKGHRGRGRDALSDGRTETDRSWTRGHARVCAAGKTHDGPVTQHGIAARTSSRSWPHDASAKHEGALQDQIHGPPSTRDADEPSLLPRAARPSVCPSGVAAQPVSTRSSTTSLETHAAVHEKPSNSCIGRVSRPRWETRDGGTDPLVFWPKLAVDRRQARTLLCELRVKVGDVGLSVLADEERSAARTLERPDEG